MTRKKHSALRRKKQSAMRRKMQLAMRRKPTSKGKNKEQEKESATTTAGLTTTTAASRRTVSRNESFRASSLPIFWMRAMIRLQVSYVIFRCQIRTIRKVVIILISDEKEPPKKKRRGEKIVPPAYEGQMFACNKDDPGVSVYFP